MFSKIRKLFSRADNANKKTISTQTSQNNIPKKDITVNIQVLDKINYTNVENKFSHTMFTDPDDNQLWIPLFYTSAFKTLEKTEGDAFFKMFYECYMHHGNLVLKPDDILIHIGLNFSKYINKYNEELRHYFAKWGGKKRLVYKCDAFVFDDFVREIVSQITTTIKDPTVVQNLKCDFTTSTPLDLLISSTVIMDSFKAYYSYRIEMGCGIQNVKFMGTVNDWEALLFKIEKLKKYTTPKDSTNSWIRYIDGVCKNISIWIEQMNGSLSQNDIKEYWNKIMDINRSEWSYGGPPDTISGWILEFYHDFIVMNTKYIKFDETNQFTRMFTSTPFEIVYNTIKKEGKILSGFMGYNYDDTSHSYQLCPAIGVFEQ